MALTREQNGNPFGSHRVLAPPGVLPQPAEKIDNTMQRIWDNELLLDVDFLNIDSASFTQIREEQGDDDPRICARILEIIAARGKMHNPVTGSGGMLVGRVAAVGPHFPAGSTLALGEKIVSLVSLSLTPLRIEAILQLKKATDQVRVRGQAVLFASALFTRLPEDIPETLALAVLDVCGAPAQTARLVKPGQTVVILGAGGKSGVLCAWQARQQVGAAGRVIGIEYGAQGLAALRHLGLCDHVLQLDARDGLQCYATLHQLTGGRLADVVINCVNIPDTELATIMMCADRGLVYFFSMATSFTKAALGAEGIGKDVDMLIGNGYAHGHAELALNILRTSPEIRAMYERQYV